jgi:hypothetical protein
MKKVKKLQKKIHCVGGIRKEKTQKIKRTMKKEKKERKDQRLT